MDTRQKILDVSLALFKAEGYEKTGIQKIANSSSITKPTIYHYFGSKRGLLEALLKEYFSGFLYQLREKCKYQHDIVFSLESIVRLYFDFAVRSPDFYSFYLQLIYSPKNCDSGELIQPITSTQWELINDLFSMAGKDHGNMKGRNNEYTITFMGMINSYITSHFHGFSKLNNETAHKACKQFMHGIFS
jgi:TetR/AcrR family transcriptional regulator